ncbi:MAG: hypothetical protein ACREM8_02110 [Vulcanimicrobiaceae bacterium]
MLRSILSFALVAALGAASTSTALAGDHALKALAAQLGYTYAYLGPEDAVALSRPGVTIVVRPGERLFDVNDRTEAMAGPAPHFSLSDIYVSDEFAARLRQIAAAYPAPRNATVNAAVLGAPSRSEESATGAITDLSVMQVTGTDHLSVAGKAPANFPVTLTLISTFSTDIPDVVLSRHLVVSDADGNFQSEVSVAPGYFSGAILTLVASSVGNVSSASAKIVMKAANGSAPLKY